MQAAMLLSTIAIDEHNLTAKTNLPDYLFSPEKVVSAIRKCRIILITIYVTTDAVYRQQCNATKAYRPVGEGTEDVQRRLNSSMLTTTFIISSMTAARGRSKCARRRIFNAAITFVTRTNVKRTKYIMKSFFSIDWRLFDRSYYSKVLTQRWQDAVQARRTIIRVAVLTYRWFPTDRTTEQNDRTNAGLRRRWLRPRD